jgi:hypothetical protein
MSTSTPLSGTLLRRDRIIAAGCAVLGGLSLLTATAMAVDPAGFLDGAGGYGTANDHLVRDLASWSAALGVCLLIAARAPAWRLPVLTVAALQTALHTVNHIADADLADPGWKGWATAVLLASVAGVTAWLAFAARAQASR